jgi:hypothetical protein
MCGSQKETFLGLPNPTSTLRDENIGIGIFLEFDRNVFHMIPSHFHQGSQWLFIMFLIGPSNA